MQRQRDPGLGKGVPQLVIFCRRGWYQGLWCSNGRVSHFCLHPRNIVFVGGINLVFGCLANFVLDLPLSGLGFTACCDVLYVGHNTIYGGSLSAVCCWALGSVVTGLVALKASTAAELLVSAQSVCGEGCDWFPTSCVGVLARGALELRGSF